MSVEYVSCVRDDVLESSQQLALMAAIRAADDLRLPDVPLILWFKPRSSSGPASPFFGDAMASIKNAHVFLDPSMGGVGGATLQAYPNIIWIRSSAAGFWLVEVVAHELRHVDRWRRHGWTTGAAAEQDEADATKYGIDFVRRWNRRRP